MLTYEQFVVIIRETIVSSACSIFAVFLVVIIKSGSLFLGALVVFSVLLTDLFLVALVNLWGLTFNNIVVVHLVASLGLSVLYSVHITHTFLLVEAPRDMTAKKHRVWSSRVALSRIGSSVLHGSVATFIAVGTVGIFANRSYFFKVFYKLWLGIVVFGMANAFILIPILLSFFGPVNDFEQKKTMRKENFFRRMSTMNS